MIVFTIILAGFLLASFAEVVLAQGGSVSFSLAPEAASAVYWSTPVSGSERP